MPLSAGCEDAFLVEDVNPLRLLPELGRACCCCCKGGVGGREFWGSILGRDGVFDFTLRKEEEKKQEKMVRKSSRKN